MNDTEQLFSRYIDICNQAIQANKDRFPFKQILAAVKDEHSLSDIEVCIIDDKPNAEYTINLDSNKIKAEKYSSCPNCNCGTQWRITRSYLEDVIENAEEYIDNPAKINWEWMQQEH